MSLRMIFARAVVWTAILCSGCVCMKEKPTERELAAVREMAFDAMRDRIGKLADDRSIYCRKELWPWKAHSLDLEGVDLDRFHVV